MPSLFLFMMCYSMEDSVPDYFFVLCLMNFGVPGVGYMKATPGMTLVVSSDKYMHLILWAVHLEVK